MGALSADVLGHSAEPGTGSEDSVDQLELQFYETQLELYDTKFNILKNEEQLLMAQIDTVKRQIKGNIQSRAVSSVLESFF